jgi:hypothetical protein
MKSRPNNLLPYAFRSSDNAGMRISLRVTQKEYLGIVAAAKELKCSVSRYILALHRYVKEEK